MTTSTDAPEPSSVTYEQAQAELGRVIQRLESRLGLEEALDLWERGEELVEMCTQFLDGARARVDARTSSPAPAKDDAPF
ncbi:exodeoxyribonuclease VII small subunit [Cellulomonas sp.]|uniref:exodeoxyribonuclease VII small subunit n=1 Tax=Cellulomonas sp. TaxID=40001 RepID=UPI003BA97E08